MIKYADDRNIWEKGLILAHSSKYSPWPRQQELEAVCHIVPTNRTQGAVNAKAYLTHFIQSRVPTQRML